ncbi:MAG TPA: glycosyltransferase family 2 protein, partial [candidate division Zixibacteria bacterium]|nr:glycosyltransferase family 2 protein [candidate division Zixibacteria bacterium]
APPATSAGSSVLSDSGGKPATFPSAQKAPEGADLPRIAVILPVLNEAKYLERTLEQIVEQKYPKDKLEVVVADGGSTDGTPDIARKFAVRLPDLQILHNKTGGPAGGRNMGVRHTSAPYVIVIDGHVHIPSRTLLADMVDLFRRTGADCLCRPQPLDPPDTNLFQLAIARARSSFLGHNPSSDIYSNVEKETDPTSSGAMWKREVFGKIGEFDESLNACEDVDFNYRVKQAGLKAWISPKLRVFYYPRDTVRGLWRQMFRYGFARYQFGRKHGVRNLFQIGAALGVIWFAFFGLLTILGAEGTDEPLGVAFNAYAAIMLLTTLLIAARARKAEFIFSLPVIFPVIHFGLGCGFLWGWWKSRGTAKGGSAVVSESNVETTGKAKSRAQNKAQKARRKADKAATKAAKAAEKAAKAAAKAEKKSQPPPAE